MEQNHQMKTTPVGAGMQPRVTSPRTESDDSSNTLQTAIAPLLKPKDVAQILGVSIRMVERLRSAGKIVQPDLYIGRLPRWKAATIAAFIERGGN
jgi:hypothetical protein